ncbi:hypothetical protein NLG97_g11090 [Lecanicillium saksenae]|uniref:Uncharacterized protein n=1 Tax=Lecanicillium saksenae TaxID=468837 RepID=A0ACC1QBD8_9HYPO|nr:hypothetical protein NLG97_g11090 [Lecanicillium saksenae]
MELSDIFRIVNLAVGTITILGGIFGVFGGGVRNIILSVYLIVFGLSIGLLEFQIPPQVSRYANFLFSFVGRGVFYVFLGCLLLGEKVLANISGAVVGIVGIAYVALEFVPSIEPPANMREADAAGWGAEQV